MEELKFAVVSVVSGLALGWMIGQDRLIGWARNGVDLSNVIPLVLLTAVAFIGVLIFKSREPQTRSPLAGRAMGTTWTLAWLGEAPPQLRREVTDVLEHWEQILSQWRDDSALSRFNRGEPASVDLARVIQLADAAREAS